MIKALVYYTVFVSTLVIGMLIGSETIPNQYSLIAVIVLSFVAGVIGNVYIYGDES